MDRNTEYNIRYELMNGMLNNSEQANATHVFDFI